MDFLPLEFNEKYALVPQDNDFFYFYKYLRFDPKYLVLGIIRNHEFKFTNPINFNDPFDCHFETKIDFTGYNKKALEEVLQIKIKSTKWLEIKEKAKVKLCSQMGEEFCNTFRKEIAVTCFNTDPLNILMWSHYANNHTGFVLEFKIPKTTSIDQIPLPVDYGETYPMIDLEWNIGKFIQNNDNLKNVVKKMVLTKADCWAYENEFRLILDSHQMGNNNGMIFSQYNPAILSSVITGSKISDESYDKLFQEITLFNIKHNRNVQIFSSKLAKQKFRIEVPNHPIIGRKAL